MESEKDRQLRCDYVVCWEHDLRTCPVEVIELKKEIPRVMLLRKK